MGTAHVTVRTADGAFDPDDHLRSACIRIYAYGESDNDERHFLTLTEGLIYLASAGKEVTLVIEEVLNRPRGGAPGVVTASVVVQRVDSELQVQADVTDLFRWQASRLRYSGIPVEWDFTEAPYALSVDPPIRLVGLVLGDP